MDFSNGKLFGKISVIDVILIAAIIILAIGFIFTRTSDRIQQVIGANTPLEVVIQGEGVRQFIVDAIAEGDIMFRYHDRQPLGTVTRVDISPAMEYFHKPDGTVILAEMEERFTIQIVLASVGSIRDQIGYFVNGNDHIAPGSEIALVSNRVRIPEGRVVSVREY